MEFIKRHYEKLLLAALLLMFIGSMVYLAGIMRETGSIRLENLKIPTRAADFQMPDVKDPQFDSSKNLFGTARWQASTSRPGSRYQKFYSDLVVTFGAARCGHDKCGRVIPLYYFGNKHENCPWCGRKLAAPPKQVTVVTGARTSDDPDGCGIPHDIKRQYGLPEDVAENVLDDLDGDGFSNLYEYRQKTALNQPKSHPPMWHRLVVEKIERIKLPLQLKAIMAPDPNDKTRWDIQINYFDSKGETRTEITMLNEGIRLADGEEEYKVKDIVRNLTEKDASGNVIDKSYIIIESAKGTRIRMQIGHDVYSPDAKALLRDVGDGKVHPPKGVGQEITLGTRKTGRSKYIIKSIDQVKKQVMLQENSGINKGKSVPEPITRRGKIRESERVRTPSQSSVSMDNGMMMGM